MSEDLSGTDDSTLSSLQTGTPLDSNNGSAYYLDQLIVSLIVIAGSIAAYYIIKYFLNETADSLQLGRG